MMLAGRQDTGAEEKTGKQARGTVASYVAGMIGKQLTEAFLPVFSFAESDMDIWRAIMESQLSMVMPIYHFRESDETNQGDNKKLTMEQILKEEAKEAGDDREGELAAKEAGEAGEGELGGAVPESEREDLDALLFQENQAAGGRLQDAGLEGNNDVGGALGNSEGDLAEEMPGVPVRETMPFTDFVPHARMAEVNLEELEDYQTLVQSFYTIDSSTMIGSDQLNVKDFMSKDMSIDKNTEGPQILIYHTHSQEAFADSVPGDRSTSIVGVGDYLSRILTEIYGYRVLHDDGEYDVPSRDDAYSVALPAITQILEENPSIQVVIDLHRDAMDERTRLVTEIDGRPTARFMFFNGLSRTRKTGNISYLYNANLEDNLAFSFQLEKKAMEYYPGLTRHIYLKAYRYNLHLRPRDVLIELGAQNNTVEEAMNACDPLAHILDMVLSGEE